jgi:hypothetical protein
MPVHDSADIENWLRPYVGDAIVYDIEYVSAGGVTALFITVDPPQWGDDIHTLRKESSDEYSKTMRSGSVYVRKSGKTETADEGDMDRLTERARRQGATLDLSVEATGPLVAPSAVVFADDARDQYLEEHRATLLSALPHRADPLTGFTNPYGETRSRERFTKDVEAWVERTRRNWPAFAFVKAHSDAPQELGFVVVNDSDENFRSVEVEVTLPFEAALVFQVAEQLQEKMKLVEPPPSWGQQQAHLLRSIHPSTIVVGGPTIEEVDAEHTRVTFSPVHVRPRRRHQVGSVVIAVTPDLAGKRFEVPWQLTSTSTRGDLPGVAAISIEAPS